MSLLSVSAAHFTVYAMWGRYGHALYVGQSTDPGGRFHKHHQDKTWWRLVHRIELHHCATGDEMDALERALIAKYRPPYNVVHNRRDVPTDWPRCDECAGVLVWHELDGPLAVSFVDGSAYSGSWFCADCQDFDPYAAPPGWAARDAGSAEEQAAVNAEQATLYAESRARIQAAMRGAS